jgi:sarcosine oxidase subunit alpha
MSAALEVLSGSKVARVILVDERENLGGELTNEFTTDQTATLWFQEAKGKLQKYRDEDNSRLKILTSATAYAWYDHNYIEVLQTHGTGQSMVHESWQTARKVLHKIRTKEVILATGAHERPMLFETNDLANIMLSQSVRRYINEFNVVAGKEIVLYGNNDSIYNTAIDLSKHNIKSKVVDVRGSNTTTLDLILCLLKSIAVL